MSTTDAGFYFAESENSPMHVGWVSVFEGPAPSYGDLVRRLVAALPRVPRYRQRVRAVPLNLGRPVWVDDEHFQILYHVRHTAVPQPGSPEQLRNVAGRVLGQRLDMAKPLWEVWLVEGLQDDRWAIISKVHHCMVDGVAATDLMQLLFDVDPAVEHPVGQDGWAPRRSPSTASLVAGALQELTSPVAQLAALSGALGQVAHAPQDLLRRATALGSGLPGLARQLATPVAVSLTGPIGPHRRWAWSETRLDEITQVRRAIGGTVNDVVLAAVTRGFRDLLDGRGRLTPGLAVRSMVPVSVRREHERGSLDNQVSAVLVDLPVGEPDPVARLSSLRRQMNDHKRVLHAVDARSIAAMGDFVAPTLFALGARAAVRTGQPFAQAVTTNVPGPAVPLYLLGRRMRELYAYVPIGLGTRVSIGIFSYQGTLTFGITADFDAFPDVDVLADGIRRGVEELLEVAGREGSAAASAAPARSSPAGALEGNPMGEQ